MFESAELAHAVDDATYRKEEEELRTELLGAQLEILDLQRFPVLVLIGGVDGAGKGEVAHVLNEWLDPRHVRTRAFGRPTEDERKRPPMWRFWQSLPPKGKIGILFGSWYTDPIEAAARGQTSRADFGAELERIRGFEQLLGDEGTLIVKLWFHLSKKAQRARFEELESKKLTRWRVTRDDWKRHARYDAYARVDERALRETSTGSAPWVVIDGRDANYRALAAGRTILAAMRTRLAAEAESARAAKALAKARARKAPAIERAIRAVDTAGILRDLPFKERLSREKYEGKFEEVREKLGRLSFSSKLRKRGVAIVFEGMDAAGKGGAIRRVTSALDPRRYNVIPVAAPTEEERAQPYLWRFWRHVPRRDQFVIYDRSWYGRVLVERVEGYASDVAWQRAYREINEFEEELVAADVIVIKLWLAITEDEQMRRFKEREETGYKQYKITKDDWRNRKRWDDYLVAASDMIDRTSTSLAPWTVIEANDKHLARVRVIETITSRIESAL